MSAKLGKPGLAISGVLIELSNKPGRLTFDLATSRGKLPTKMVRLSLSSFDSFSGMYFCALTFFCFFLPLDAASWTSSSSSSSSSASESCSSSSATSGIGSLSSACTAAASEARRALLFAFFDEADSITSLAGSSTILDELATG